MGYIIDPPRQATLPIKGTDKLFPVHRIYCIGRNYAEHAKEMGHDPNREPPFFFQKNPDNLRTDGKFPYPSGTSDVHHEIELIVALKSGGRDIKTEAAMSHVLAYGIGLDMTRRDLQGEAKKLGRPWEVGKAFEDSAPATPLVLAESIGHPSRGAIWLDVNGKRRQTGDLTQMIWDIPGQIAYISSLFELRAGDLIMTGTPSGVAAIVRGDKLHGHVDGVGDLHVEVV